MDNIRALLDKVEILPMSPSLLPKLLPHLSDVNANFDEVVRIISIEQTLTAKLLQICNSAFFGQDEPVSTVTEAVNRVGYQSIYLLTAMINGSASFPQRPIGGMSPLRLWKHSVATAFTSKFTAEAAGEDASLLFTAGLMHDIGKLILAQIPPQQNATYFHQLTTAETLADERRQFGCDHAVVGAQLVKNWGLPEPLVACIHYHHDPQQAHDFQKIAACITVADGLTHGVDHPEATPAVAFTDAMAILEFNAGHIKGLQEQFGKSRELIDSMSNLPL
ncbi:MAG TPA: HDOD domain-containing protein [Verrucomicrobiae bacterium]|nr:HDOD domain-containing protein [Verrucomicrobiae bacterium]